MIVRSSSMSKNGSSLSCILI